ncbi:hypothetical protein BC937DRAFT_92577, partial [Endogone sp. FLAS-F59071]
MTQLLQLCGALVRITMSGKVSNEGCVMAEIMQYQCEIGVSRVICTPCPGKPAVEVTPLYDQNGEPSDGVNPYCDHRSPKSQYDEQVRVRRAWYSFTAVVRYKDRSERGHSQIGPVVVTSDQSLPPTFSRCFRRHTNLRRRVG